MVSRRCTSTAAPGVGVSNSALKSCSSPATTAASPGSARRTIALPLRRGAPADRRRDVVDDRPQQPGVVLHPELVGHGEQQRVGLSDRGVAAELLGDDVRLADVAAPKAGDRALEVADLVLALAPGAVAEVLPVEIADDRQDAAAHRDARLALPAGRRPRTPEDRDLLGLEVAERHAGVL